MMLLKVAIMGQTVIYNSFLLILNLIALITKVINVELTYTKKSKVSNKIGV